MKVLIADKLSSSTVTELEKLSLQVEVRSDLSADTLPGAVGDVGILVVRSTKVTAATIQAAGQLKLIIRAGAGVDTIDLAAATRPRRLRGQLSRQEHPGRGRTGHRADDRRRPADRRCRHGPARRPWQKKEFGKARGLAGRTLGILGFGAIGRAVFQRAGPWRCPSSPGRRWT